MWVAFLIGFICGFVVMFFGWILTAMGKKNEYEEKLWELEKLKARLLSESRERQDS